MGRLLRGIPVSVFLFGSAGLLVGLLAGILLYPSLRALSGSLGWVLPIAVSAGLGVLGAFLGAWRHQELARNMSLGSGDRSGNTTANSTNSTRDILMDTSAIIDGRIADLAASGFLAGALHLPSIVLDELRRIADSSEPLRRNRGRRGLDVLARLNRESRVPVKLLEVSYEDGADVDARLLRLAQRMHASLLTTDYNLNRAAELHGVTVLNINELANALRQVVLPGEDLMLRVIQEGREVGQGIGFLDDGTMVVIEGGRRYLNTDLEVTVSRVLQTATGRIIFAQPKAAA